LNRSVQILRLFLTSEVRWTAAGWFASLVALLLSLNALNVVNSYVGRDFMTAISDRQIRQFVTFAIIYGVVFAVQTVMAAFYRFSEERLRLLWRGWLTERLIGRYMSDDAYFRITTRDEIDNPDERITEDVKSYTQTTLSFFLLSLNAALTSLAFLGVLWSITPMLVIAALVYAAFGSAMTILLGRPLVRLTNLQLEKEADLRYHLIQSRETAEAIATMRAEKTVRDCLIDSVRQVLANNKRIIKVTRNLGFLTNGYNYLIQLIPLLIVAPLYIHHKVEFGVVTQSAMAFAAVLGAFSLIVTQFETLSSFAAVTERLDKIVAAIEQGREPVPHGLQLVEDNTRVAYSGLTLWTRRERRPLIDNLSLEVLPGSSLLITGSDAASERALFLATAGLWEAGTGQIRRPGSERIYFVPKDLLTVRCDIRSLLAVTTPERRHSDADIQTVLEKVGLESLGRRAGGLDAAVHGPSFLSPAELQLLVVARVLLASPQFVFLDRIGGDLGPDQLALVYRLLDESSISYLSIGDDRALAGYHTMILELNGDGTWTVRTGRKRDALNSEPSQAPERAAGQPVYP
jgi:putative ATP-binding cassette transporter